MAKIYYTKDVDRRYSYTAHGQLKLDFDGINETFAGDKNQCNLILLDNKQVNILLILIDHFLTQYKTWGIKHKDNQSKWNEIEAWYDELEHDLMSGCDLKELLQRLDNLTQVAIGSNLGLPVDIIIDGVTKTIDFTGKGLGVNLDKLVKVQEKINEIEGGEVVP
jgi:hypothetical protein